MSLPVILLAFANSNPQSTTYLRNLAQEAIGLREVLTNGEEHRLCEFEIITDATYESIVRVFQQQKYRGRIAIFHYAGHAGTDQLFLKDQAGGTQSVHSRGLIPFLADQPSLQLVFLNGCHTHKIADGLTHSGVPAVIGTSFAIRDDVATRLAINFYRGLTHGLQLESVWKDAIHQINATEDGAEMSQREEVIFREDMRLDGHEVMRLPWSISFSQGKEDTKKWNLPQAAKNPLFGLASVEDHYDLLNEPFEYLKKYGEKGTRNFFGRNSYIQDLYKRLLDDKSSPLILLYGQSGVGKSSFLNAGLLPRLKVKSEIYIGERTKRQGLTENFIALLDQAAIHLSITPGDNPLNTWLAIEAAAGRPLLLVLDQIEEVFTRPQKTEFDEMGTFLALLVELFSNPLNRPKGKLLLSYRKEFHPEVNDAIRSAGLPFEQVFLKKLDSVDIKEVVEGISSTNAHRRKYNITIETGLPEIIAADLLKDINSPIAPVLQILLTKMWGSVKEKTGNKQFSISLYRELQRKGIFLHDFYQEQMHTLTLWSETEGNEVVASGLALDVLHFHTTDFGTAEHRHYDQIADQYHHQKIVLPDLLVQLKDLYLLAGTSEQYTTLAHDTLAPIIQQAIKESNLPGQRAHRLLEAKKNDFEDQTKGIIFEADDLVVFEEGQRGMRAWTPVEQALIERSRKIRKQQANTQKRTRQLLAFLGLGIVALAILSSIAWWRNSNKAKGNELLSQALKIETIDPVRSLALTRAAYIYLGNDPAVQKLEHDIYSYQAFYDTSIHLGAPVRGITLVDDGGLALLPVGNDVQRWNLSPLSRLDDLPHNAIVQQVAYAITTESIISSTEEHIFFWDKQGGLLERILIKEGIHRFAVSPDASKLLIADQIGGLWLLEGEQLKELGKPANSLNKSIAFTSTGDSLLVGNEDGLLRVLDTNGNEINSWQAQDNWVLAIEVSAGGNELFTSGRDGLIKRWTIGGQLLTTAYGHEKRVNNIQLLGTQGWLTASDDGQIRWWDTLGRIRKVYRGHTDFVYDVAAALNSRRFYSVGADSTLRVWRFHSTTDHILTTPSGYNINSLAQAAKTGMIVAGTTSHLAATGDEFFNFEDALEFGLAEAVEQPLILWKNKKLPAGELPVGHVGPINSVAVTADGKAWVSGGEDGLVNYYNEAGEVTAAYESIAPINSVALTNDGQKIGFTTDDEAVIWQPTLNDTLKLQHPDWVNALVFSPDGKRIYTAAYDSLIRVFDTETGQLLDTLAGHGNWISSLAISPDGRELLSGDWNNEIIRWSAEGQELNRYAINAKDLTGGEAIFCLAYSRDGKYFAFTTESGVTQVMDKKGYAIQTHRNFDGYPDTGILFSADSQYLIRTHGSEVYYWKLLK